MNVKDLIEELKKFDPSAPIADFECVRDEIEFTHRTPMYCEMRMVNDNRETLIENLQDELKAIEKTNDKLELRLSDFKDIILGHLSDDKKVQELEKLCDQ
jgi:hypothetical protein